MPLGIIELLTRVGEDNVRVQNLRECSEDFTLRGKGARAVTMIRFGTQAMTPTDALNGTGPVGLIVWLPKDAVDKIMAALAPLTPGGERTP